VVKLKERLEQCFAAAASATGCTHKVKWIMQYLDMQDNKTLGGEYKRYMESEQKTPIPISNDAFGSTDFVGLNASFVLALKNLSFLTFPFR
jgi:metal-dependent amidase/aminoacylase/carboxypeptidase family protein